MPKYLLRGISSRFLLISGLTLGFTAVGGCGSVSAVPTTVATIITSDAETPTSIPINSTPTYPVYEPSDRQTRESAIATQEALARTPPPGPTLTAFAQQLHSKLSTPLPITTPSGLPYTIAGAGRIYQDNSAYMGFPPIKNRWVAEIGDESIEVYAGRDRFDATQGVLVVLQKNHRTGVGRGPDGYNTPIKAGAVAIIDAVDQRLTLRAADGTLFYFDVPTRQWVTPGPSPVPSLLPTP